MVDQVLGIGGVSLLVFLGVRLTQAFRDLGTSMTLAELEASGPAALGTTSARCDALDPLSPPV